ncbi:MAG: GatB/YqeY domain-containing protein [Anaerolineae bacterium]|nr:GatB/YqeY domain-containing protein [Anaerolineae bacterium]
MQTDLKEAMKAKDAMRRDTLRSLSAAFKQTEVDEQRELTEADVIRILQKEAKRRQESITEMEQLGRDPSAEQAELAIINDYLPDQMDETELEKLAREAIAEAGATSAKDMGNVMKILMPRVAGRADGKAVNQVVRQLLS